MVLFFHYCFAIENFICEIDILKHNFLHCNSGHGIIWCVTDLMIILNFVILKLKFDYCIFACFVIMYKSSLCHYFDVAWV